VEGDDSEFKLKETVRARCAVPVRLRLISRPGRRGDLLLHLRLFLGASADAEIKDYLVILDNKEFHPERAADDWAGPVPYRPAQPHNPTGEGIGVFTMEHRVLPKDVLLKDYNYRKPTVEMKGTAPAEPKGFGTYFSYGDHFKTPEDGNALAEIRAQGILCRVKTWQGHSAVFDLEPALIFTLEDHPIGDWNGRYVITRVTHRGSQPGATLPSDDPNSFKISYENAFTCIKADTQWRPELLTPWPSIHGVIHATIDAAASGEYAELDDQGRYKVKLPFDLSDIKDGKASRYIRMAQPYSGPGMGMHFPLHKGTEVLLIHIDGDPDRPIIVASIPNPDTQSPVAGKNQTQCAIHTGGGNKIVIEDSAGGQRIALSSPTSNTFFSIGAPPE
jgi:type VI secretion system secreted protein VgrG